MGTDFKKKKCEKYKITSGFCTIWYYFIKYTVLSLFQYIIMSQSTFLLKMECLEAILCNIL